MTGTTATRKFPCKCGGPIRIVNSRAYLDGLVRRRHRCLQCNAVYTTIEIRLDKYRKMLADLDDFKKLKEVLSR